ncbi:MAG: aldo/keto reductase [Bauldia sp.]
MHPQGPEFSGVIWGSMRSEEQFDSSGKLADHLRFLLDRGITTLDTANTYGIPHPYSTEEFLGRAIREVGRDKFEIVTKGGIMRVSPDYPSNRLRNYDFTAKNIRYWMDRSLQKLGVDQVDLYLLHRPDYLMDPDEAGGVLDALIVEGKTRYVGVSNFSPSRFDLLQLRMKAPLITNQVEFSPLHLAPISNGVFDHAIAGGYRPMIWSPVGGGNLLTSDEPRIAKIRAVLTDIAKRTGLAGPAEAAMAFVARHPANGVAIVGSGKRERVEGAIAALTSVMDRQDWYEIVTQTSEMLEL